MSPLSLATFALIFALGIASPGPVVAALVARVIARGPRGMLPFCAALLIGDLLFLACAAFGLAALAALFQPMFLVLKYAGAAYLLFVAWKLWTAPPAPPGALPIPGEGRRLFATGLTLALGNPKTMLFYVALLPSIIDLGQLGIGGFAEMAGVILVIGPGVLAGYVLLAARLRRLLRSARSLRLVNRVTGTVMASAAVAVATR